MASNSIFCDTDILSIREAAIHWCGLKSYSNESKNIIAPIRREIRKAISNGDLKTINPDRTYFTFEELRNWAIKHRGSNLPDFLITESCPINHSKTVNKEGRFSAKERNSFLKIIAAMTMKLGEVNTPKTTLGNSLAVILEQYGIAYDGETIGKKIEEAKAYVNEESGLDLENHN